MTRDEIEAAILGGAHTATEIGATLGVSAGKVVSIIGYLERTGVVVRLKPRHPARDFRFIMANYDIAGRFAKVERMRSWVPKVAR